MPGQLLPVYEYLLLLAWVVVDRVGIPLSAAPILVVAGALSAGHGLSLSLALLAGFLGAMLADIALFLIGRRYGQRVMGLICKMSFEPAACVRRTQDLLGRHSIATLTLAKFVPGLATLTSPVAARNGMPFRQFLLLDGIGSALWVGSLLAVGYFFRDLLVREPRLWTWAVEFSGVLFVISIVALLIWRIVRYRLAVNQLAAARLNPEELKRQLDSGRDVFIVDLRHPLELLAEPFTLPGAVHFSPDALAAGNQIIPRDRDVVLYCTCPSEATSTRTAMALRKLGIERVHPLRGGYDEWKRMGFPLDPVLPPRTS